MRKKCALIISGIVLTVTANLNAETPLESAVLKAVRDAHFEQVIDFGAGNENHPSVGPITYTQRVPVLGKAIDDAVTRLSTAQK